MIAGIPPNRMFNVEETYIDVFNVKSNVKVLAKKGAKRVDTVRGGKCGSHISLVICVDANGLSITPTFIFQGKFHFFLINHSFY